MKQYDKKHKNGEAWKIEFNVFYAALILHFAALFSA
jgi:hypothetical protein